MAALQGPCRLNAAVRHAGSALQEATVHPLMDALDPTRPQLRVVLWVVTLRVYNDVVESLRHALRMAAWVAGGLQRSALFLYFTWNSLPYYLDVLVGMKYGNFPSLVGCQRAAR